MKIELLETYGVFHTKKADFLFDLEDLPLIKGRDSWYCDKDGYLVSSYYYNGVRRFVRFHKIIMHAKPQQAVDHINHNRLDNQKKNLRICEWSENNQNRGIYSTNKSGTAGVYFDKERSKWAASISYNGKRIFLGRFASKEEAAVARLEKRGRAFDWEANSMTIEKIREMVSGKSYNIIFLTLGGSYSYGTNVETSDVDVRGCALNSRSDLLGLSNFEQVVNTETDTTVHSFNKLISLLLNCNPNTIEMLGCKPEHYFLITDIGQEMIDNRKLFLSKRAVRSFGGYATQQLRRLENAIARDRFPQARREEHTPNSMKSAAKRFEEIYTKFDKGSIVLYTDDSPREGLDREVFADIHLTKYPVRN